MLPGRRRESLLGAKVPRSGATPKRNFAASSSRANVPRARLHTEEADQHGPAKAGHWSFYILSPGIARAEALALQGTSGSRGLK